MQNRNWIKKVGNIAYYLLVVLIIILLINNFSNRSNAVYNIVGFRNYTILTGSMEPKIYPGDLVIVKKENPNDLKVGDIITFNKVDENIVVTHRLIAEKDDGFITKGDNNNVQDDGILKKQDVIGKVVLTIPKIGYIFVFFAKPLVIAAILIILGLSIGWDVLRKKDDKEDSTKVSNDK